MYRIEVSPAAERDLGRLKDHLRRRDFERLRAAIGGLSEEPRPRGVRKIKGAERAYRIRAGDYRVVYEVYEDQKLVLILHAGRRKETTYKR